MLQRQREQERVVTDRLHATIVSVQTPSPTKHAAPDTSAWIGHSGRLMDTYLQDLVDAAGLNGTMLVASHGQILLRMGDGFAVASHAIPNTPETHFWLGSLTKQFTAMAIHNLQTRGALNVDDPACRYLSNCPPEWEPITIHQLLTHTSGIPNYTGTPAFAVQEPFPATPEEIVAPLRERPLLFMPGEGYGYSNANNVLPGMISECLGANIRELPAQGQLRAAWDARHRARARMCPAASTLSRL